MATFLPIGSELQEEHDFCWIIPNFLKLYDAAQSPNVAKKFLKTEFTVGEESTGIPTNWQFYLMPSVNSSVKAYLKLLGSGSCSAKYKVQINSSVFKSPRELFGGNGVSTEGCDLKDVKELHLNKGTLQIMLSLTIFHGSDGFKRDFSKDFKNALDFGIGSDFTLICNDGNMIQKIPVSKSILSIRSPVFLEIAGAKDKLEIYGMTAEGMNLFLRFIYTGEIPSVWAEFADELLFLSDLFAVDPLKKFLCENITPGIISACVEKRRDFFREHYEVPESPIEFLKQMKEKLEGQDYSPWLTEEEKGKLDRIVQGVPLKPLTLKFLLEKNIQFVEGFEFWEKIKNLQKLHEFLGKLLLANVTQEDLASEQKLRDLDDPGQKELDFSIFLGELKGVEEQKYVSYFLNFKNKTENITRFQNAFLRFETIECCNIKVSEVLEDMKLMKK